MKRHITRRNGRRLVTKLQLLRGQFRGWTVVEQLPYHQAYLMRGPSRFWKRK